jgi:hypothetical protein
MHKTFKLLKIAAIVVLVASGILTGLVYAYSDKLEEVALKEVNKHLAVEGSYAKLNITLWRSFPRVALQFHQFYLKESTPLTGKDLLFADVLYLEFNLFKMFKKQFELEMIHAQGLTINLATDLQSDNFSVFRETPESDTLASEYFKLDLSAIIGENVQILYCDLEDSTFFNVHFDMLKAKGDIDTDQLEFELMTRGKSAMLTMDGMVLDIPKEMQLNAILSFVYEEKKLRVQKGNVTIDQTDMWLDGDICFKDKGKMDFHVVSKGDQIGDIAGLLPQSMQQKIRSYQTKGKYDLHLYFKGPFLERHTPEMEARFSVKDGYLIPGKDLKALEKLNISAVFRWSAAKTSLQVSQVSFATGGQSFSATFDLNDLKDPYLSGVFKGHLNVTHLSDLLDFKGVSMGGQVFCDFSVKGKVSSFNNGNEFKNKGLQGKIDVKNFSFSQQFEGDKYELSGVFASIQLKGNLIQGQQVRGVYNGSPFRADLTVEKLLPYLFHSGNMICEGNIHLDYLHLSKPVNQERISVPNTTETMANLDLENMFIQHVDANMKWSIGSLEYDKMTFRNVQAGLILSPQKIHIHDIKAQMAGGEFEGSVFFSKRNEDQYYVKVAFDGKRMDMQKMLLMFNQFGQDDITDKNLSGVLYLNTQLVCLLKRDGSFEKEDIYAFSELKIENGQLKNVQAMQALSDYAEVSELANIRFQTLSNSFEIRNGELHFPYMDIGNNVMNLRIKGKHHFDQYMDYTIRIRLADALAAKYKIRSRKAREDFEDFGDKGVGLYISIKGYPDQLEFKLERIAGKPQIIPESVTDDVVNARKNFKDALQQEFSKEKRDERKKREAEMEIVEWDEW